jgi:hypothetical protein
MAQALSIVRHPVNDYATWRKVYDEVQPLRDKHGVKADEVYQSPADPNDVTVLHWFPSASAAEAFASDPGLKDAMGKAGVSGAPRIEIVTEA